MFQNLYSVKTPRANGVRIQLETKFQFSFMTLGIHPSEIPRGSSSEGCKLA
jgi:hypothetical protein